MGTSWPGATHRRVGVVVGCMCGGVCMGAAEGARRWRAGQNVLHHRGASSLPARRQPVQARTSTHLPGLTLNSGHRVFGTGHSTLPTPFSSPTHPRPYPHPRTHAGLKMLVQCLLESVPLLLDVLMLLGWVFCVFGVTSLILFMGKLHGRCFMPLDVPLPPADNATVTAAPATSNVTGGGGAGDGGVGGWNTTTAWVRLDPESPDYDTPCGNSSSAQFRCSSLNESEWGCWWAGCLWGRQRWLMGSCMVGARGGSKRGWPWRLHGVVDGHLSVELLCIARFVVGKTVLETVLCSTPSCGVMLQHWQALVGFLLVTESG